MSSSYTYKIYFGGLPQGITHKELTKYFRAFGSIERLYLAKDINLKKSLGHGYILCGDFSTFSKILESRVNLKGNCFYVDKAIINAEKVKDFESRKKIWVTSSFKNFGPTLGREVTSEIKEFLSCFGEIQNSNWKEIISMGGAKQIVYELSYPRIENANLCKK